MSLRRGLIAPLLAILLCGAAVGGAALVPVPPARAAAARGTVSFTQAQGEFNCTICHEPLNEARSPEAFQENALLRKLIRRGDTLGQIRRAMIANYGISVLANPPKRGFAVLIVVVPVVVIVLGLIVVGFTIPRWRRRSSRQAQQPRPAAPAFSDADEQRLAAELARRD
jgi:cytochrome c-type biogenesis protein CcmH/NrfF